MANAESGQSATYSFLVHSSISSEAPPRFDGPANPKQKRKRTSPHDQVILEAAYQKNSKPDKTERAEIVRQVDLGEKEVQIWFQNRRQNDRRKSKPLEPHELLAHFRNGTPFHSPSNHGPATSQAESASKTSADAAASCADKGGAASRSPSIHELLNPSTSCPDLAAECIPVGSREYSQIPTPPSSFDAPQKDSHPTRVLSASTDQRHGVLSHTRKRSHEIMSALSDSTASRTLPPLQKSSSFVRLAVTVDGAVKVRTNNELTPSPPKQRIPQSTANERRSSGLTRSQSDVHTMFDFKDVNPPIRRPGGAGFGRSRDARTWEFYCDRDSTDMLSTQAEAERNGSAVGAINLIRSSSQRNKSHALSPNLAKQNSKRPGPAEKATHGKPKLSRARSSMARLQHNEIHDDAAESKTKRLRHDRSPSNDSDKENWAPGTRLSHNPLRRMQPSAPRSSVLQEHEISLSHAHPHLPTTAAMNTAASTMNDENRALVSGEACRPTPSRAKGDDLDCIQGLLSLSQGAWR